jgi:hypothetical protein
MSGFSRKRRCTVCIGVSAYCWGMGAILTTLAWVKEAFLLLVPLTWRASLRNEVLANHQQRPPESLKQLYLP